MKVKIVLVIFVLSFLLTACAPGVQPLLDDYNALFEVTLRDQQEMALKSDWLPDSITMSYGSTLNLHGPAHCSSYKWELKAVFGEEGKIPDGFDIGLYGGTSEHLVLNFKTAGFSSGSVYEVVCTVEQNGQTFSDSCKIIFVA